MRTAAGYVTETLKSAGLEQVFGIPGVHNLELYRAIAASGLRHVAGRHEQGVGFMADGYARVSGRPGVCFTITGPGLTNITTAMAQAYCDSVPMLVISTQNARTDQGAGQGLLHELTGQLLMASLVAGNSWSIGKATDLPDALSGALAGFATGRPRPAYLEIPRDVLLEDTRGWPLPRLPDGFIGPRCTPHSLSIAAERIRRSRTPVLLAGGGARGASRSLAQLSKHIGAPVVMTTNARGLLAVDDPLAVPFSPSLPPVRSLIAAADVVVAVGTELGQTDYDMLFDGRFERPRSLIRIDIEAEPAGSSAAADFTLVGDADATLRSLLARDLGAPRAAEGLARARAARAAALAALSPAMRDGVVFLDILREVLPQAIIVGDSTQPVYAGNLAFAAATPRSWFNSATGFGTLGYALPASTGAGIAAVDRPVICLTGDGGLQFSLGELAVLREVEAWTAVLVWNNRGYREIKSSMIAAGIAPTAVDFAPPDLKHLARAYGYDYRLIRDAQGLRRELRKFGSRRQIVVMEVVESGFMCA